MKKILSFLSIILGIVTSLAGFWLAGLYVYQVIGSIDAADKSIIFWGIPLLFIGLGTITTGALFTVISIKSLRSHTAFRWTMGMLIAWIIIVPLLGLGILRNENKGRQISAEMQTENTYLATANKIVSVSIPSNDTKGFNLRISTSGGFDGDHKLTTRLSSNQTTFLETSENKTLGSNAVTIDKRIEYNTLFARCASDLQNSGAYVCINNTLADITLKIEAELMPTNPSDMTISSNKLLSAMSSQKTEVTLETENRNNQITVKKFTQR